MNWKKMIAKIRLDQSGATAVEYCLILALIAIGWVVALSAVADTTVDMWDMVSMRVTEMLGG